MLFVIPEEVSNQTKANLEQSLKFAETAAGAAEGLFNLNVQTAKAASADVVGQVKALTAAKDVQELTSLQVAFVQANTDKLLGYARAVYGWATETHAELSKVVETQVSEANRTLVTAIDKAAKSAPTGSEFAFAAVKTALSTANQAYDALNKASKQVVDITEATVSNATAQRKKAA